MFQTRPDQPSALVENPTGKTTEITTKSVRKVLRFEQSADLRTPLHLKRSGIVPSGLFPPGFPPVTVTCFGPTLLIGRISTNCCKRICSHRFHQLVLLFHTRPTTWGLKPDIFSIMPRRVTMSSNTLLGGGVYHHTRDLTNSHDWQKFLRLTGDREQVPPTQTARTALLRWLPDGPTSSSFKLGVSW